MKHFAEVAFTPAVQALQAKHGSRGTYARMQSEAGPGDGLGPREAEYLAAADSFYLATVSETGWPYVQHRGGPRGFLRMLGPTQLAFADFRGNRQFVSAGNAAHDDRVALIVMDYPNRRRLKLLGRLHFIDASGADPQLVAAVELPDYRARVERVAMIDVEAFDWNCPQHITQRYTRAEFQAAYPTRKSDMTKRLLPPFNAETALAKVQAAEDAWNTCNPDIVVRAYSKDTAWRNRDEFFTGRRAIKAFLARKWAKELHYRLKKELWAYTGNRISVRFEYEWQDATSGRWFRTHGNEHWEFNDDGLMRHRDMSANDILIEASERLIGV